jgi:hypothetical protein
MGAGRPAGALEHVTRVFDRNDPAFHEAARFMSITYLPMRRRKADGATSRF